MAKKIETTTITLLGKEYKIAKMSTAIWAELEDFAEAWHLKTHGPEELDPQKRAMLPIDYITTTRGRLVLLMLCLNAAGNHFTLEQLMDMLPLSEMTPVANAIAGLFMDSMVGVTAHGS